jgi:hypothetical protein
MKVRLQAWLDYLNQEIPECWNEPAWLEFQQEAIRKPGNYLQEWISLGRLASWLQQLQKPTVEAPDP